MDPLVVQKFAQRVENGELKVFSVHLSVRLLFYHRRCCGCVRGRALDDDRRLLLLFLTAQRGLQIALIIVITACHGHSRSSSPLWRLSTATPTPIIVPLLMPDLLIARRAKLKCHDRISQVSLGLRPDLHQPVLSQVLDALLTHYLPQDFVDGGVGRLVKFERLEARMRLDPVRVEHLVEEGSRPFGGVAQGQN